MVGRICEKNGAVMFAEQAAVVEITGGIAVDVGIIEFCPVRHAVKYTESGETERQAKEDDDWNCFFHNMPLFHVVKYISYL